MVNALGIRKINLHIRIKNNHIVAWHKLLDRDRSIFVGNANRISLFQGFGIFAAHTLLALEVIFRECVIIFDMVILFLHHEEL